MRSSVVLICACVCACMYTNLWCGVNPGHIFVLCKPLFPFPNSFLFLQFLNIVFSPPGVKQTEDVRDEPNVEIYFQSGSRAASMKDLVRNFIRKATMVCAGTLYVPLFACMCSHACK